MTGSFRLISISKANCVEATPKGLSLSSYIAVTLFESRRAQATMLLPVQGVSSAVRTDFSSKPVNLESPFRQRALVPTHTDIRLGLQQDYTVKRRLFCFCGRSKSRRDQADTKVKASAEYGSQRTVDFHHLRIAEKALRRYGPAISARSL